MTSIMVKNIDGDEVEIPPKSEEELMLERLVFGDTAGFEENLKKIDNLYDYSSDEYADNDDASDDSDDADDDDMFYIDDNADEAQRVDMDIDGDLDSDEYNEDAWDDSDDERIAVSLSTDRLKKLRQHDDETISGRAYVTRLRSQFEKIHARPEWADRLEDELKFAGSDDEMEAEDEDDENSRNVVNNDTNAVLQILGSALQFVVRDLLKLLPPHRIGIVRLKDANYAKLLKSGIQSLQFHHSHPLLMTGGFDKTLRVYHVDGKANSFVSSLYLHNTPIMTCAFSPLHGENLVYAAGRRRYMNKWDLTSGAVEKISRLYGHEQHQRSFEHFKVSAKGTYLALGGGGGWCNILNGSTGQWIRGFKIEGMVVDFAFTEDESTIVIINRSGDIWEYNLDGTTTTHMNRATRRWKDDGGVGITKMVLGGGDRWLAVGSNNGVVNLYDRNAATTKPFKVVENLVSLISSLKFSPDGQVLCVASRAKRDALHLVHMPSGTVFSNWPTSGTPLGRVSAVDFSPNNEMLAVGNEGGKVTLWRLTHY